jgi:outer membrane protein assembly factor BamB
MRFQTVAASLLVTMLIGCGRPPRPPGPPVAMTTEITAKETPATTESADLTFKPDDWPMWRGPNADGVVTGPALPTTWSATDKVTWKTAVPGQGHASPIIIGDRIFLETADEQQKTQLVICFNRENGKEIWRKTLFEGHFETQMHRESSQAASTLASDGNSLYCLFLNDRKIWAIALNLDGEQIWKTEVGSFSSKFGYSASPTLYKSLVLLAADHQEGGFLAAVNRADGSIVWRKSRPAKSSYASPRVVTLDGQDQLVICGCREVSSYNPLTGDQNWTVAGTAESGVGLPVTSGNLVIASAGWPERETIALKSDGSVAWRNKSHSYVPSLLAFKGHIYLINDGIARCFNAESGKETWQKRIGGDFRTSPIASGDNIYVTDMAGKTTVFQANPKSFELVVENRLGTESFASPAGSKGQMFVRVADASSGPRQEWLYCIGSKQ